ncbi:MAG: hypothetical protein OEV42_14685 [Deltaproteobacteria bacterium]|nr:hypothetical protein [Deltaproteobacteria bacterium]
MKKGLNGWIEVFRAGKHTDSKGRVRNFTETDLDLIAGKYDPAGHEAPVVIGHPKSNGPAYAWLEGLKRAGNVLLAKFKDVNKDFNEMVESGAFKKRSISLYPDLTVRHVGFLGAQPPAIKGLKDISFNEGEEFNEYNYEEKEETDMPTVEELQAQLDEERKKREAAEKNANNFKEKADGLELSFSEQEEKRRKKDISDFVEQGIKDGKILPAWKKQGLVEFLEALEGTEGEYEFSEGKDKQTPAAWFKGFISSFSEHPLFKQMARPEEDDKTGEAAEFAECEKVGEEMAAMVNPPSGD